mmetsp:Transcript_8505/g.26316  ORF Transcript_8505/g.26316 Transcript_8505/m.26316 type:complete len:216 (+) Transcript_8505:136-783(+)
MPAAVTMRRLTPEQLEVARKAAQAARDFDVPPLESSAGWTFSRKQLRVHTRSRKEGIKATEEAKRRFRACELISKCSQMLKIPTQAIRVMTTAQTFFHRYYLFHNIVEGEWDFMVRVAEAQPTREAACRVHVIAGVGSACAALCKGAPLAHLWRGGQSLWSHAHVFFFPGARAVRSGRTAPKREVQRALRCSLSAQQFGSNVQPPSPRLRSPHPS